MKRRAEPTPKSEETRALILNTALALFVEQGFDKTTMREIAAEAGVALGAAYYYFAAKDALVLAFYEHSQQELESILGDMLARPHKNLQEQLHALLKAKLNYFGPNRKLLGALAAHTDPAHSLSPFSTETRAIRERDMRLFTEVLEQERTTYPKDIAGYLPSILWLYQMGLILYWVFDSSSGQRRTWQLLDKSLPIVVRLIQLSALPLLRPLRRMAVDLLETIYGGESLTAALAREKPQ